jgi:hypothetical protein
LFLLRYVFCRFGRFGLRLSLVVTGLCNDGLPNLFLRFLVLQLRDFSLQLEIVLFFLLDFLDHLLSEAGVELAHQRL